MFEFLIRYRKRELRVTMATTVAVDWVPAKKNASLYADRLRAKMVQSKGNLRVCKDSMKTCNEHLQNYIDADLGL